MTLATGPELLLLDEPTSGMSAVETGATMALIGRIAPRVPCEQNARTALEIGDWHHIIDNGRIRFSGTVPPSWAARR